MKSELGRLSAHTYPENALRLIQSWAIRDKDALHQRSQSLADAGKDHGDELADAHVFAQLIVAISSLMENV